MKRQLTAASIVALTAVVLIGAKDTERSPVEVGKSHYINNGSASMKGKIIDEINAFFIQELMK